METCTSPTTDEVRGARCASCASAPTPGAAAETPNTTPDYFRGVDAAVTYVQSLVSQRRLPYIETIQWVGAKGDDVVVGTTLANRTKAAELWEALSTNPRCGDRQLEAGGYRVLLADGSVVDAARPGFTPVCLETGS
jgi:hypothetical protein